MSDRIEEARTILSHALAGRKRDDAEWLRGEIVEALDRLRGPAPATPVLVSIEVSDLAALYAVATYPKALHPNSNLAHTVRDLLAEFATRTPGAEPPSGGAQSNPELHINPHNSTSVETRGLREAAEAAVEAFNKAREAHERGLRVSPAAVAFEQMETIAKFLLEDEGAEGD